MSTNDGSLAEYNKLREEIKMNSQLSAQVFTVTLTATAILLGYGFKGDNWLIFLMPFTLLLPTLWFISTQLESTTRISTYINVFLESELNGLNWENRLSRADDIRSSLDMKYSLAITVIYLFLAILCLALAWINITKTTICLIIITAITVLLLSIFALLGFYMRKCFKSDFYENYCINWKKLKNEENNKTPNE